MIGIESKERERDKKVHSINESIFSYTKSKNGRDHPNGISKTQWNPSMEILYDFFVGIHFDEVLTVRQPNEKMVVFHDQFN